ncbi:hypothetical protein P171DRAFT_484469 [Karstenula rhodostoma CBS 690.94]|uniref:Uncharacterized protein n=1 Tax=Karstenula rhodostoma CBS 690.94 TaxID=1392251 RepID=A0A9P4PN15_9PLEO|nr:hypothetical protein P171DRAFT_484469 [Karstenula rhodostoma CBS 690.94]
MLCLERRALFRLALRRHTPRNRKLGSYNQIGAKMVHQVTDPTHSQALKASGSPGTGDSDGDIDEDEVCEEDHIALSPHLNGAFQEPKQTLFFHRRYGESGAAGRVPRLTQNRVRPVIDENIGLKVLRDAPGDVAEIIEYVRFD